jgi:hypothetical protein
MRGNGISYDTGYIIKGRNSREPFDPEVVERELRIIRDDLHCNAVRATAVRPTGALAALRSSSATRTRARRFA